MQTLPAPRRCLRSDGKTTTGRIDLYRRGSFVLEAKQYATSTPEASELAAALGESTSAGRRNKIARGTEAWDDAMIKARGQADVYARNLPAGEPTPPFLLIVDVGHVIELYADFSQKGKAYLPFPDARSQRFARARPDDIAEILHTLVTLGRARQGDVEGTFVW